MKASNIGSSGINWYCETQGEGPWVVLVPSGEGDCANFSATAALLAGRFSVLTFDTPGFSRSSAPADPNDISIDRLADQIAALVHDLGIESATFYGCSSGGRAVLDLAAKYPELVHRAVVHEVALLDPGVAHMIDTLVPLDDAAVIATCREIFGKVINENEEKWLALGDAYHERLERNYVTWVRRYLAPGIGEPPLPQLLAGRPITWSVGSLSDERAVAANRDFAQSAGIPMSTLPCRHFPQVSIPDQLASHIAHVATEGPSSL